MIHTQTIFYKGGNRIDYQYLIRVKPWKLRGKCHSGVWKWVLTVELIFHGSFLKVRKKVNDELFARRSQLRIQEPGKETLTVSVEQVDRRRHSKHQCFTDSFLLWCWNWKTGELPRWWGDSAYGRGRDARRKFWIKPLKETDLGVAQAFFDP